MQTATSDQLETVRPLGEGENGTVWAVREKRTGRLLARKRLATPASRRELTLLARLQHPNVITLESWGVDGDGSFLLTKLYAGDLSTMDRAKVPQLLADALRGLAFLHSRGLVHGDLKPQNLLLDENSRLALADFGLAATAGAGDQGGTLAYMSPERLRGAPADASGDLYSLGAAFLVALGAPLPAEPQRAPEHFRQWLDANALGALKSLFQGLTAAAPEERPASARAAAKQLAALTNEAELAQETHASAAAYLRPYQLLQRDSTLDALDDLTHQPGVIRLRAAPGAGGSRLLEEWALRFDGQLASFEQLSKALPHARLALDDASHGDERVTAQLIELQRKALEGEPVPTVIALVRPDDALDRALGAEGARSLDLAPLSSVAFAGIVSAAFPNRGDSVPFAKRLHALSGGSPQRALAVLSSLHEQGKLQPGALTDADVPAPEVLDEVAAAPFAETLTRQLRSVLLPGSAERLVATLIACARRPLPAEVVREAAQTTPAAFARALEQLWDRRLVTLEEPLAPDGEHVRAALDALLTNEERETAHTRLALVLESLPPASAEELLSRRADVAWHELRAHGPRASALIAEVAPQLLAQSRPREAIALLRESLIDDAQRVVLAKALAQIGDFPNAEQEARAAKAFVLLAEIQIRRGDYAGAIAALEKLPREESPEVEALFARALAVSGQHDRALEVCEAALNRKPAGLPAVDLAATAALALYYEGDLKAAEARYEAAARAARAAGDKTREANAVNGLGLVAHRRSEFDAARSHYAEALRLAEEAGDRARIGTSHLNLGTVLQELGRSREAAQEYRRSASVARLLGEKVQSARARSNLANLLLVVGRIDEARAAAEESRLLAESAGAGVVEVFAQLLLCEALLFQGRPSEAERRLVQIRDRYEAMGNTAEALEAEIFRAQALLAMGETAQAEVLARSLATRARERSLERHEARAWLLVAEALLTAAGANETALAAAHRAMALVLPSKRPDLRWRAEAWIALASEPAAQGHHAARALAALQTAANAIDPEDRSSFLARADRARLRERLQPLVTPATAGGTDQRLARILSVNRKIGTERNLKTLLETIVDEAVELCGAERGFVLLAPEKAGGSIDVMVARNIDREALTKGALKVSHSIAERVITDGEPELTLDAQEDERYQRQLSVSALKLRSVLCVPLRLQGRVLGALYIDNRFRARAFGNEDLGLLESFADQAAIAMGQVRALEDAQRARQEADQARREIEVLNRQLAERVEQQEAEIMRARREADEQRHLVAGSAASGIVGESPQMVSLLRLIQRVAGTDLTVLVTGESGTGKELVARALFSQGSRRDKPFVSINCAALNEGLLESELFGHVRGAFTGADRDRDGLFQVADGGTLFLDEVGDMGLAMQAKLLRALQEGEIRKVGGQKPVRVDVRVIAATNRDLPQLIKEGKFREDLYYRLNVVSLHLPPLRERAGDLPLLCARLLAELPLREDGRPYRLSNDALALLSRHPWPGNIRELRATLHNAALFSESDLITARDFAHKPELTRRNSVLVDQPKSMQSLKDEAIARALEMAKGNKSEAARLLGIDRKTLYNRLRSKVLDS